MKGCDTIMKRSTKSYIKGCVCCGLTGFFAGILGKNFANGFEEQFVMSLIFLVPLFTSALWAIFQTRAYIDWRLDEQPDKLGDKKSEK